MALRDLGRIERSLFTLDWLRDPALRRRANAGLNKGEARNALARAMFFHRLGEMRDRSFENQTYRASGLIRLGLPMELRRSLACTNIIENMNGTIRQVCRNVKRWQDASMALRWTSAAMLEAAKGFRRLKAHKQLPILRAALLAHQAKHTVNTTLEQQVLAA